MTQITSLAAFKRALKPGDVFHCENRIHPEVSGPRTVVKVQARALCYQLANGRRGWTEWPKAGALRIEDGALHFLDVDGSVAFTYSLTGEAKS